MGFICIRRLTPTIKNLELNLKINQSHYEGSNDYKQDEHRELLLQLFLFIIEITVS